jgi:chromosome partitioning protein
MFDGRTSLSRGVVNELPSIARAANTKMFHTIIRKCEAVNKAQSANVSIFDYDPNCNAVADFTDFVNEYLEGEDY